MDSGQFVSATIVVQPQGGARQTTLKGIAVRVGDDGDATMLYDTELLRASAGWTGGFLRFDPTRYAVIGPPASVGDMQFTTPAVPGWADGDRFHDPRASKPWGPLPTDYAKYRGLYVNGDRVVLRYTVGDVNVLETPWAEEIGGRQVLTRTLRIGPSRRPLVMLVCEAVASAAVTSDRASIQPGVEYGLTQGEQVLLIEPHDEPINLTVYIAAGRGPLKVPREGRTTDLLELSRPAAPLWTTPIVTTGGVSKEAGPLVVDTIQLPFDNPYKALMFIGGHDFFSNGDAAICTVHGDVWIASGIDESLKEVTWRRYATGLFQPLGLKIVDDVVYVVGRDQITRLHDRNDDGEADYYENFNNDGHVTPGGHEFVTCLECDEAGNFYYIKGDSGSRSDHDGCVLRVTADGSKLDVFATGFRNANGMSIGPRNQMTVSPQEGTWTPASAIFNVKQGGFYGAMQVHHRPTPPTDYDRPICWLPRLKDNSSGGQVWIPEGTWGPLGGGLLHLSFGHSSMMYVVREQVGDVVQGGTVELPFVFESGVMRGRFRQEDGHLYVSGLRGWVSNASRDGCFQRVRYTGEELRVPTAVRTLKNGLAITFGCQLDRGFAEDRGNYYIQQWNYRWSAAYGSPEYKVSQPGVEGRDDVPVRSATLQDDGRTVFLELAAVDPVMQMSIRCMIKTAAGDDVQQTLDYTINRVPDDAMPDELIRRRVSRQQLTEEKISRLRPGLAQAFEQNSGGETLRDARRSRLAAIHVPGGEAATPYLAAGSFRSTATGYLRVPLPGNYRLGFAGQGEVTLFVNDRLVLRANGDLAAAGMQSVRLRGGYNGLRIEYASPGTGDATMRLLWESETFATEPVPPSALRFDPDDETLLASSQQRRGRQLLGQNRCFHCHRVEDAKPSAELTRPGPDLSGIGDRLNTSALREWVLDPHAVRADAEMPRLLGKFENKEQVALDIAAYLSTLRTAERKPIPEPEENDVARGARLFEQLGCIACHRFTPPEQPDHYDRVSLYYTSVRYKRGQLAAFLSAPHRHYRASRMPDFQLSRVEARRLAAIIHHRSPGQFDRDTRRGDRIRGQQYITQLGCASCHRISAPDHSINPPPLRTITGDSLDRGCLGQGDDSLSARPTFDIDDDDRSAIVSVVRHHPTSLARQTASEQAERLVSTLRCAACHERDGMPSQLPPILLDESESGLPPQPLPQLTWTGEKLQPSWTARFLRGEIHRKPRPWLKARMPAFPAHADVLATGLSHQHGFATNEAPSSPTANLHVGYHLTQRNIGLDCRQCHGIGNSLPRGDDRTQIAFGINFADVPQRLRYGFYRRFVLDPPRFDVRSKMPKLAANGRQTKVTHIYDGDARRQFDAIWSYLQTLGGDEP